MEQQIDEFLANENIRPVNLNRYMKDLKNHELKSAGSSLILTPMTRSVGSSSINGDKTLSLSLKKTSVNRPQLTEIEESPDRP